MTQRSASSPTSFKLFVQRTYDQSATSKASSFAPETGAVAAPDGFPAAYKAMVENGLNGIAGPRS